MEKNLIPGTVMMLDSGTVRFEAGSPEEASSRVSELLKSLGGKPLDDETWSFSDAFRHRYLVIRVDACSDGGYAASIREGNAPTDLLHYGILVLALAVMAGIALLMRSWWSILPCIAVIVLAIWLIYAPERASLRRAKNVLSALGKE